MNKTAIMTDTNSGILPVAAKQMGIYLLQMPFFVDGEEFFEYGSMDYSEFFGRMTAGAEVSTSQPSPGALCEMWDEILKTHDNLIYIPMSSALSGTCSTAKMLSAEYDGRVFVVDNKRVSVTLRSSVFDAISMRDNGHTAEEIVKILEEKALDASVYVAVNTLEYLKKSGRVTAAGAAIGTVLGIKPVLQIKGEKLDAFKKVRGMVAAVDTMLDAVEEEIKTTFKDKNIHIRTAVAGKNEQAKLLLEKAKERFPAFEIELDALPLSLSCHVGPGAMGIGIYETERQDTI